MKCLHHYEGTFNNEVYASVWRNNEIYIHLSGITTLRYIHLYEIMVMRYIHLYGLF